MNKRTPQETNLILKLGRDPFDPVFLSNSPVEYILGKSEFRGKLFNVNKDVLIPRIETEEIIDLALNDFKSKSSISFADIATGSGVIGISFALELLKRKIQFDTFLSDISDSALKVAKTNVNALVPIEYQSQITILKSDLLNNYPENKKFDVIFANLPYIPSYRIETLNASVKDFEPHLALDGGEDGLDLIIELVKQSKNYLNPGGVVYLEVDDTHTEEVASKIVGDFQIEVKKDQFEKNRFWILRN